MVAEKDAQSYGPSFAEAYPLLMEIEAPKDVNPKLWQTYHSELIDRISQLRTSLAKVTPNGPDQEVFRQLARTLHTIKSASMVVPADRVTHCTHLIESLLLVAKEDTRKWSGEGLEQYIDWLDTLVAPPTTVDESLATGQQLQDRLDQMLTS